jgi:heme-degrading monooxygenase HmoA
MSGRVRVLVWHRVADGELAALEEAYHQVSRTLRGTPGLLGSELLRSGMQPWSLLVISEWESMDAFRAWEEGAEHRATTAPLRPYRDHHRQHPFELYEVAAAHQG